MVWVTQDDISEPQKLAENDQNRPKFPKSANFFLISLRSSLINWLDGDLSFNFPQLVRTPGKKNHKPTIYTI